MNRDEGNISVVIPHFGDPRPTLALVNRLLRDPMYLVREVIIVDDASPIPLGEVCGATVVRRDLNGGFGSAVNSGAARASGDHLLVLNSDLEISGESIRQLLHQALPLQPAVVSPRVVSPDGQYQWVGRRFPTVLSQAVEWATPLARFRHHAWWHRAVGHQTSGDSRDAVEVDWVAGAAMLIPLVQFRSVHGFDEGFFMNSEEVDLQRRLRNAGVRSYEIGGVEAVHEGGGSSDPGLRRKWLVRSRLRYARKWRGSSIGTRVLLSLISLLNFSVNGARQLLGRDMRSGHVLLSELKLLWADDASGQNQSRRAMGSSDV